MSHEREVEKCKNMIDRLRFDLFADKETREKSVHTYLITRDDGSQRYFKALTCEFEEDKGEATFYKIGQMVSGTIFTHVISVETVGEE